MPKLKKKSPSMIKKEDMFRKQVRADTACQSMQEIGPHPPHHSVQPGALVLHDFMFHGLNPESVLRGEIDIVVMDFFSAILKNQFGQIYGLIPPSVIYQQELSGEQTYEGQLVPEGSDAVQIHFLNSHYIVSSKTDKTITIYDSLRNSGRVTLLNSQLHRVYHGIDKMNINYEVPQNQGASVDCGLFAAANAYFLLTGKSPCQLTLNQNSLRQHLWQCLQSLTITDFPHRTHTSGNTLLDNYLEDQALRQRKVLHKLNLAELKQKTECEKIAAEILQVSHKEKLNQNEKDMVSKKDQHMNPGKRSRDNEREALAQRKKREDPEVRRKRNESETPAQRKKRVDPEVRRKRNESETPAQRKKREDSELRRKRNESETPAQRKKREDSEVRRKRNESETPAQRKKREDSEVRRRKNERETPAKRKKREDSEVRRKRIESETPAQRKKREDSEVRRKRNESETPAQRKKREDSEVRRRKNERETPAKRKKREDSEVRRKRIESETPAQRKKREDSEVRRKRNESETPAQRKKREDSEVRRKRNESETPAQRKKREDAEVRRKRNQQESQAKRERRKLSGNVPTAIKDFKSDIQKGPTFICTICNRMLYRSSLKKYDRNNYEGDMLNCSTDKLSHDGIEYVCTFCHKSLKQNKLPSLAVNNNLQLSEIPYEIDQLNSLESIFISRRIPFMKMLALPRGKQKAVHGCVVNVPIEPDQLASILPRVPSADTFITVKLKRKLKYRGHSYISTIRPQKINDALHVLKNQLKNPLYEDVVLNKNWIEDSCNVDPELWDSLVQKNQPFSDHENNEQLTDEDSDTEEELEDNRSKLSGIPFDTCIQPKDIVEESVLSIAPGEGKRPISFAQDKYAEEMAFPQLFPTGKFGLSHERPTKLSMKKYFQARLLNCDGRFAKNIDYIFYAQYRVEAKEVYDSISLSLRKGKQQHISAGDLKTRVAEFPRTDLGIHFMQKIRGSPAFYNKMFYDLLGMIRQLGPCTLFVTLSAADLKWTDTIRIIAKRQGRQLTDDDIQALSWEEKCQYLRSDPVTAARHFNNRVSVFFKHILLNKQINPLGEVVDYKYRIEFQQRGSPHLHMLVWIKDAPSLESSDEPEVKQFVDNTISCELPEQDPDLLDLVNLVQRHTHSVACRKHGKTCRFAFPRPPLDETLVLKPLENPPSHTIQEVYSTALTSVSEQLADVGESSTLQEILDKAKVTKELYLNALHWIKTKSGQPAVLLKRKPVSVNINNYNTTLMKAWEANIDVQYVTNVYSCVMYLASYVSKPEKTLGDVLRSVSESSKHLGIKQSMRNVANKFLTHREVSAQEAVYRVLSLPLTQGSREVLFVATDMPEDRTRLFKSMEILQRMDDDDEDVYQKNLLDRYSARPDSLEDICLAEFATNYRTSYKPPTDDSDLVQEPQQTALKITLKGGLGFMIKRNKPAIIRTHQWSLKKQAEHYYHAKLLLYYPWRNETNDLLMGTYQEKYELAREIILQNSQRFEHNADELANVLEEIDENGFSDDHWITVAPETEQARREEAQEGPEVEPSVHGAYDTDTHNTRTDANVVPHEYIPSTEDVSNKDWKSMILSLNHTQYQLHQFLVTWANSMLLAHTGLKPNPFYIFLTGGAGVGKSFLVRTIVQTLKRLFQRDNQIDDTHVLVCAPTGAAAYNIAGHTCHSLFQLPVRVRKHDDYIPLSRERLAGISWRCEINYNR